MSPLAWVKYALASMHISQFDDPAKATFNRVVLAAELIQKGPILKISKPLTILRELCDD